MDRDLVWMIGGRTGEGVDSAGDVFAAGAARSGNPVAVVGEVCPSGGQ